MMVERMPVLVRPARPGDLAAVCALLLRDAADRATSDGALWVPATDAAQRVAGAFSEEVPEGRTVRWLVAEVANVVVGVVRFGVIPCPPIYHLAGGLALLLFDETCVSSLAPEGALAALIEAAEREGAAMGAVIQLAACAAFQLGKCRAFEAAGYAIVTQYLVKHGFADGSASRSPVRVAAPADIPAIVAMGVEAQKALCEANAKMWKPHPDAPTRFGAWMQYSLRLPDRRILVFDAGEPSGFVIAQPASALHVPISCERSHIGLIDDFWASAFAAADALSSSDASMLLCAAEAEFVRRGRTSTMAICPKDWRAKNDVLRGRGYVDGNTWMLKA
jgi:hypothetical protein